MSAKNGVEGMPPPQSTGTEPSRDREFDLKAGVVEGEDKFDSPQEIQAPGEYYVGVQPAHNED